MIERAQQIKNRFVPPEWQWSCIFDDYVDEVANKKVLLDHICVTNDLRRFVDRCGFGSLRC